MKQVYYSEELNKYFDTPSECLEAEKRLEVEKKELEERETKRKNLLNKIDNLRTELSLAEEEYFSLAEEKHVKEYMDKVHLEELLRDLL